MKLDVPKDFWQTWRAALARETFGANNLSPRPEEVTSPAKAPAQSGFVGERFEKELGVAEIAKRIRGHVRQAIADGKLSPALVVSVRSERGRARSVDIKIIGAHYQIHTKEFARLVADDPNRFTQGDTPRYTPEAQRDFDYLKSLHDSYNFDKSDSVADIFHRNYYGDVTFDADLSNADLKHQVDMIKRGIKY